MQHKPHSSGAVLIPITAASTHFREEFTSFMDKEALFGRPFEIGYFRQLTPEPVCPQVRRAIELFSILEASKTVASVGSHVWKDRPFAQHRIYWIYLGHRGDLLIIHSLNQSLNSAFECALRLHQQQQQHPLQTPGVHKNLVRLERQTARKRLN
jgi:hypothetical protein